MVFRLTYHSLLVLLICVAGISCHTKSNSAGESTISEYTKNLYILRAGKDEEMLEKKIIETDKIKDFKGLNYFEPDSSYRLKAKIKWLGKEKVVFKTNSERSPTYYKFCSLTFQVADSTYTVIAYTEDMDAMTGLFIPFKDKTNNHETYGGGRYIEVPYKGEKETFELDFNLAFNPYCHYNHGYSCPLVPFENTLNIEIPAGEKKLYE